MLLFFPVLSIYILVLMNAVYLALALFTSSSSQLNKLQKELRPMSIAHRKIEENMIHCLTPIKGLHILNRTSFLLCTPASPPSKAFFHPLEMNFALVSHLQNNQSLLQETTGRCRIRAKWHLKNESL